MQGEELQIQVGRWSVGIRPGLGGCLSHFRESRNDGDEAAVDWLRPLADDSVRNSACYPLVPFSNRIDHGCFRHDGRDICLAPNFAPEPHAIHGQGWQREWEVTAQHADSVTIAYDQEAGDWPWSYRAEQTVALAEGRLSVSLTVTNFSGTAMPVGLGLHPFFLKDGGVRLALKAAAIHETADFGIPQVRNIHHPAIDLFAHGRPLPEGLDNCFDGWDGTAVLTWADGRRLTLTSNGLAGHVVVYSPEGRNYFCVEPVTHMTDAANRQDAAWGGNTGWRQIQPDEKLTLSMVLAAERV